MAFSGLTEKLSNSFKKLRSKGKLTEADVKEAMREVRLALLEADVNYRVAKDFTTRVTERAVGSDVMESLTPAQMVIKIVNEELTELMGGSQSKLASAPKPPTVILMCGLQGAGKTTHAVKLAHMLKTQGHRPMLVAGDIYRPAAIKQLQVMAEKAQIPVFEKGTQDPVKTCEEAVRHARDYGNDYLIIDTAGRLQIDQVLMDELKRICAAVPPQEVLLVVDAMTGQEAVNVAKTFDEQLSVTGVILTKLDGDTRGGAALSIRAVTGKPIKFSGTGEKIGDLEAFHPDRMASRILGMGDVLTLIEKAQDEVDEQKAMEVAKKLKENSFDMEDLLEQIKQVRNMGPLGKILEMFPGMSGKITDETAQAGEQEIKYLEAIINSMTKAERANPDIINPARKRRIAAGSGTDVPRVNRVLKQYKQMKEMMKLLGGKGKNGKRRRRMPPFNPAMLKNMPPM